MVVSKTCISCKKVIEGFSEKHADYLMLIHTLNKHPEKVKIRRG